ncbi:MAG: (d)CMP kinase [bacterium]
MKSLSRVSKLPSSPSRPGLTIAIDGPAASGKSTAAKLVAKKLGYLYLDTGAMYRALTWKALRNKVNIKNGKSLSELAKETKIALKSQSNMRTKIYLDGKDVTSLIRSPLIDKNVSLISVVRGVREAMVAQQRKIGKEGNIVAEGRDIGTVVFPKAEVKIFLTASVEERVKRRWKEEADKGLSSEKKGVAIGLLTRDRIDSQRKIAPLKKAREAIVIDNTCLNISQTVDRILEVVKTKLNS